MHEQEQIGPGRFTSWTQRPFVTGSAPSDLQDAVRRIADLTRDRESVQQLPAFAAQLLGTSSAHIALISDVQEVQGGVGLASGAIGLLTPPEDSMCTVTVNSRAPTAIEDAPSDPRVAALPPVTSGLVRSYLGVPLEVRGLVVGALCVFDESPRHWTEADVELLKGLAAPIIAELELAAVGLEHESERVLWQLAVDAAGVGAFDWYLERDELRWDERLLEIFGLDADAFGGTIHAFNEAVHPDDRPRVTEALRSAIESCGVFTAEYRIIRPDGGLRWINARGRALAGPDGVASRVLGAASDVTSAVEGEQSVRRVLEAMPSAFFHLDRSWRFSYLNAEAARLLGGIGTETFRGEDIWELFPAAVGSDWEQHYRRAVETDYPVQFEAYYPPPLDTWYDVRAWPTPDGLSVYFTEATDRRRAQAMIESGRDRAELLAGITEALTGTLHTEAAAAQLARLVVGPLADWSMVSLIDHPSGRVRPSVVGGDPSDWRRGLHDTAGWHVDPSRRELVQRYLRVRIDALTDESYPARALEEDRVVVVAATGAETATETLLEGEARDLLETLAPSAIVVLPLKARGRTLGLLTVCRSTPGASYSEADVDILTEISARAGLAMDNARLYADQRDLAEQLQRSMLTEPPLTPALEIAVRYVPAAEAAQVGGDWYDAFDCTDDATVVVIGDVVGHDFAAAAAMGQLRGLVRGISVGTDLGPAGVLTSVDSAMHTLHLNTMATAIIARMTPHQDGSGVSMTWANAGHPPPVVIGPEGWAGQGLALDESQILLGLDSDAGRTDSTLDLPSGTVAVFYTDGLVERRRQNLDTGMGALRTLVEGALDEGVGLEDLCDRLLTELLPAAPEDDVALIAVRIR